MDDKIKRLNSSRFYKKITPKHDLSWYIKWVSSFLILAAVACRATGVMPMFDLWFSVFGTIGWFAVGMLWHDRALIVLNAVSLAIYLMGVVGYYFQ